MEQWLTRTVSLIGGDAVSRLADASVLLCGLLCGAPYGAAVGFIAPLLRHLIFGMPAMPSCLIMAFEMAAYDLIRRHHQDYETAQRTVETDAEYILLVTELLFRHPLHPYTQALLSAIPQPDPISERKKVLKVYDPSCHHYEEDPPFWEEVEPGHFVLGNHQEMEGYRAAVAQD